MLNASQPALFNARTGVVLNKNGNNKYLIYAGGVRVLKSTDYKEQNYYTWQVGGQWHFAYYDRGTFYVTGIYSPKFISYGIGMSYNLFKDEQGAANAWAGTSGLGIIGALNIKASAGRAPSAYKDLNGICNELAGTTGKSAIDALRSIAS